MRDIAKELGRAVSSISDEIARNKKADGKYDSKIAKHKAYVRKKYAKFQWMKIAEDPKLRAFVEKGLCEGRSPKSISERIRKREKDIQNTSRNSVERFLGSVHGRKLEAKRNKLKKKKQGKGRTKLKKLDGRKFIDIRPKIADQRKRVGDVEADFIVSGKTGKGIFLTVADRKLRVSFIEKVLPVSIKNVHKSFKKIKKRYPEMRTITTDNDILLARHKVLEKELGVKIYFCHPYHSWEKGTIENTNGEIRKYIPKGSDISKYSSHFIRTVEKKINDRYMECLDSFTPQEMLNLHRKRKKRRSALKELKGKKKS